jgi:error-prone DNA polymerase
MSAPSFVHLNLHSAFSFGDGASSVESLVLLAAEEKMPSLALTDTMSLSGLPSFVRRCQKAGIQPIGGAEVLLEGGRRLTLLADGPKGFSSLSRILSAANLRDPKRHGPRVRWEDLETNARNLVCLTGAGEDGLLPRLLRRRRWDEASETTERLCEIFGRSNVCVEVTRTLTDGERSLSLHLFDLADTLQLPAVATNAIRHADKMGMAAHEILRRVALHLGPYEEHGELPINAERYLKSDEAMRRLFPDRRDAVENTRILAATLASPLDPTVRHLPRYPKLPPGESTFSYLCGLVWQGAKNRFGSDYKGEVTERLLHELEVIRDLGYCDYFLICKDVCDEARRRDIGFALRGSAVGSAVAYCLSMSEHDPVARRISFERFLSKARQKPPDIDIDFRHDRRDSIYTQDLWRRPCRRRCELCHLSRQKSPAGRG